MTTNKTLIRKGLLESRVKYEPPGEGNNMARELLAAFKRHSERTLLVDASENGRQFSGAKILDTTSRIASALIKRAHLEPGQPVLTMCDHTGQEVLFALGVVLAGGALFGSSADEGYDEERILCQLVKPSIIVARSNLHQLVMKLKNNLPSLQETRVVWIDNPLKQVSNNIDGNNNNNNNNNDDSQYYASLIERDQVLLFDDLVNEPRDDQLIEDVCQRRIDAKRHHLTYMLTSGSTGRPKVVPNTHEELMHGIYSMISACRYPLGSGAQQEEEEDDNNNDSNNNREDRKMLMSLSRDCIFAGDLPLDHGAGVNTIFLSLYLGSKLIIMPSYDVDVFWQTVNDYKITTSIASTTFTYKLLVRLKELIDSNETNKWDLSSLKSLSCAGSKLAFTGLVKQVNEVYKHLYIGQCYGCTEIGFISILSSSECRDHLESVGHLMPGLLAKLVNPETGELCGPGERGELLIWANSKFKGYKCHRSEHLETIMAACHDQDNFYKTGDQAHYDSQGRLYIHGRYKETLFLMEDWKILPVELEEVVDQHPLVERSAVVGVPDPDLIGCDAPKAFVKLISTESKNFAQLDETDANGRGKELKWRLKVNDLEFIARDIFDFVAERTAKPKHLKGGVRILDEFPTNGLLNKIDRKALRLMN